MPKYVFDVRDFAANCRPQWADARYSHTLLFPTLNLYFFHVGALAVAALSSGTSAFSVNSPVGPSQSIPLLLAASCSSPASSQGMTMLGSGRRNELPMSRREVLGAFGIAAMSSFAFAGAAQAKVRCVGRLNACLRCVVSDIFSMVVEAVAAARVVLVVHHRVYKALRARFVLRARGTPLNER